MARKRLLLFAGILVVAIVVILAVTLTNRNKHQEQEAEVAKSEGVSTGSYYNSFFDSSLAPTPVYISDIDSIDYLKTTKGDYTKIPKDSKSKKESKEKDETEPADIFSEEYEPFMNTPTMTPLPP